MSIAEVKNHIAKLENATLDYPFGENVAVFKVGGKMFALVAEDKQPVNLSLKCDPQLSALLQSRYESVMPGYHLNKKHWITVVMSGQLAWPEIADLIQHSYDLVRQ